ncbi:MAG TPA: ATP-dependent sacrificial sulfur transferase LarE [Candidatus Norongarragalinales archaeon]|nr:ATP-dependent sacrificial sulfur transferase LarE [Candidatus Norongarragalinales archaeon]
MDANEKIALMCTRIRKMGKVIVAFSGGIDSTLVLKVATEELGVNAIGITASSPSLAEKELEETKSLAAIIGANHEIIFTQEMEDGDYAANPINRCYFCKTELYDKLRAVASERGIAYILDGLNADDLGDYRPGMKAAKEHLVVSPLKDAGITKNEIREIAKSMGLPNWDKPSSPCLSSRFPYGTKITLKGLRMVDKGEAFLRELGIEGSLRVRYLEKMARIEVESCEFAIIVENSEKIISHFRTLGFEFVELDLRGFKSGRMNEAMALKSEN